MRATLVLLLIAIVESKRQRQFNLPMSEPRLKQQSVDFGHVYRNSVRNNEQEYFPELESAKPKKEYPKEAPKDDLTFLSPRDQIVHERMMNKTKDRSGTNKLQAIRDPIPFDYSQLLDRNIVRASAGLQNNAPHKQRPITAKNRTVTDIRNYFQSNTFLKKISNSSRKWTTCDEFKKKAVFHPDDVVNTKWLPFYIWSDRGFDAAVIHTLSYPTKKSVQHYKTNYGPYLDKEVNWREPKLLLKEMREMLLIAGDRRGLFYAIPEFYYGPSLKGLNISLPIITLRMKIYDPYLVMMYCDDHYAIIMAEQNTGPQSEHDKKLEAEIIKFKGKGKPAFYNEEIEKELEELSKKRRGQEPKKFISVDELNNFAKRKLYEE